MSFWNSRHQKARKEHKCIYCGKKILVGEMYYRETGTFEGDFNDYCLCELCRPVILKYHSGEEIGELWDDLEYFECPKCKSGRIDFERLEEGTHKYKCTCDNCDHKWEHELTLKDFGLEVEN